MNIRFGQVQHLFHVSGQGQNPVLGLYTFEASQEFTPRPRITLHRGPLYTETFAKTTLWAGGRPGRVKYYPHPDNAQAP